uniref:Uncharacterized protein n=1 Tax=Candidatus Kentrum sp. MB TaxID=2138164 RepID=A0A451BB60_9GAMM|nr:MAG: hypothetical protein BECKMB1821G_GA0114241_102638 [Candidatus Kentron sp. MB]VFK31100.1 MAG: hypothetical protein BECKMB1821I_GA0114274_102038 [Candidatus Kentron sp. MB]VFK75520.1 MAG: hypothetical protein BECKMB1821H_GA0114242_102437 [Candidatus Kentron sp. MB]
MNFIERCLSGDALMDEIDDYVERWSDGEEGKGMALHDFLGMTWEEYSIWGTRPSILPVILRSKRNGVSLDDELGAERRLLVARADGTEKAERMTNLSGLEKSNVPGRKNGAEAFSQTYSGTSF